MKFRLILGLLVIFSAAVVSAQTNISQTVDLAPSSYTIDIPESWSFENTEDGSFTLTGDGMEMVVMTESALAESGFEFSNDGTLTAAMVDLYQARFEIGIDPDFVRSVDQIKSEAVVYRMEPSHYSYMIAVSADERLYIDLFEANGDTLTPAQVDIAVDVIASVAEAESAGGIAALPGIVDDVAPSDSTQGTGEACTVTASADPTRLRVGPGENRTSIAFLGAGSYDVLGEADDNEGDLWYKLDKDQAAPNTAANEIWVAAADVDTEGDCGNIGDVAAPPVIPGAVAPPPAPPAANNDSGAAADNSGDTGNAGGFPIPQTGNYVTNYGLYTSASCQYPEGLSSGSFLTADLGLAPEPYYVSASADGSVLTLGGSQMFRDASGTYTDQISFDGVTGTLRIRAVSSTRLEGSMIFSITIEGNIPCSMTVPVGLQR